MSHVIFYYTYFSYTFSGHNKEEHLVESSFPYKFQGDGCTQGKVSEFIYLFLWVNFYIAYALLGSPSYERLVIHFHIIAEVKQPNELG